MVASCGLMIKASTGIILFSLLSLACTGERYNNNQLHTQIIDLSETPVDRQFSLNGSGSELYVLYPDMESLSLKLSILSVEQNGIAPKETFYLDRISYTPEIDFSFGQHLYLILNGQQHIFYYDSEGEGKKVLKWINKDLSEDTWRIDIVSSSGKLIAAINTNHGSIALFSNLGKSLILDFPGSDIHREIILNNVSPRGDVSILPDDRTPGFTLFDATSHRLYLIRWQNKSFIAEPIFNFGEVHYAEYTNEGDLKVLAYDSTSKTLSFLEKNTAQNMLTSIPVTLSQGTNSVFFFYWENNIYFLFNEVIIDRKMEKSYRLSLIFPEDDGFKKKYIFESSAPINKFKALFFNQTLYIAFIQENLKLMSLDISELTSVNNHDL